MSLPKRSNSISSRRAQAKADSSPEEREWLEGGKLGSASAGGMSRTSSFSGGGGGGDTLFHYGEEDD